MKLLDLPLVGPDDLPDPVRAVLRPGETVTDRDGMERRLPAEFLVVDRWDTALNTRIAPDFMLWELISVDVREAPPQRSFPRYVPCAVLLLAQTLQLFRREVGTYVHIAANGGYRTPAHSLSRHASRHCWGTAANIYRVGDSYLEDRDTVERYARMMRDVAPGVWIRPWGNGDGEADDHLHVDLGYTIYEPVRR